MKLPEDFFTIELEMLGEESLFPFHLFVFNPMSKAYSPFLYANSPFTQDKRGFVEFILKKGGQLAVGMNQKRTFLRDRDLKEEDILSLRPQEKHELEIERERKRALIGNLEDLPAFHFKEEMANAIDADDYRGIIQRVRTEISTFSVKKSHTVSLAIYLAEKLLIEDNFVNRIVSVSYLLAKNCDMSDEFALGDLVTAAYFGHIGHTQLDISFSHKAHLDFNKDEKKAYQRHPGLSHHLIKKSGSELSDRCKYIIFEHHERYDGSGYPSYKKGGHIEPLALVLGAVSHIFEYSEGKITGNKQPMRSVILNLEKRTFTPGLEFEFGDRINENLVTILSRHKSDDEASSEAA